MAGPAVLRARQRQMLHGRAPVHDPRTLGPHRPASHADESERDRPRSSAPSPNGASADFSPLAAIVDAYISTLAHHLPAMSRAQTKALAEPTRLLLVACAAARDPVRPDGSAGFGATLARARRLVRDNIATPEFGPLQLSRELAMSRSKLYRLFERTGGVAAFIQRERLRVAFERLADRSSGSIGTVAVEVGFSDHSTFSRAFRREFGVSPRDIRDVVDAARTARPHGGR